MPTDALVMSFDNFDLAQLVQTGFDMVQNNHAHNITDFAFKEKAGGRWIHDTDETGGFQGAVRFASDDASSSANTFNYLLGGPFSVDDQVVVSFMAKAAAAHTISGVLRRTSDKAIVVPGGVTSFSLTTIWQRFVKLFTLDEIANSIYLSFSPTPSHPTVSDVWIADVHAWKILDTESLPKCDTITFAPSQGISSRQSMDEEYKLTRRTAAPRTAITISDPYANSDPAFWLNKLGDPGRRWQYGVHVDGDMGEAASSWTAQDSASTEFTAEGPLIGADVLEVTDPGSGSDPRAAYITGRTGDASRNMVASAWLWHDSATGVVDSAPMIMSDGLSAYGVDDPHGIGYTLTDIPTLLKASFVVDTAPTKLTHNLQAPDTSTNTYRFDAVKLERSQYSPVVQCQPAYLWGLWVRFDDGTNYHYMFVPAVRWMKSQSPVRMGKFLIDSINGSGGELLRWKVAK